MGLGSSWKRAVKKIGRAAKRNVKRTFKVFTYPSHASSKLSKGYWPDPWTKEGRLGIVKLAAAGASAATGNYATAASLTTSAVMSSRMDYRQKKAMRKQREAAKRQRRLEVQAERQAEQEAGAAGFVAARAGGPGSVQLSGTTSSVALAALGIAAVVLLAATKGK
jgi:hypothetical protein